MKDSLLKELQQHVASEKTYLGDGYYRIREKSEKEVELASLLMDPCGGSVVNPQITLVKAKDNWEPVKLIDLGISPTEMYEVSEETAGKLKARLDELVGKFQGAISSN